MGELRTRKPTGKVPFPMVMIEGGEKDGKSYMAYALSSSPRVGRTFVFSLGERTVDGYERLGPYEIVEHNGTYVDVLDQIKAATAVPAEAGKPNVIVIDSGSQLWFLMQIMADQLARSTRKAKQILAEDPDAEIDTAMPHWNKVKDKWWAIFNHLRGWPGIVVVTCRAGYVTKVEGGRPVQGQVEWSTQIEKGTPFVMTAIVTARFPKPPVLRAVESLDVTLPDGGLELPLENTLDHLVFSLMGAAGQFEQGQVVNPSLGVPAKDVRAEMLGIAMADIKKRVPDATEEQLTAAARKVCGEAWTDAEIGKDVQEVTEAQRESVLYLLGVLLRDAAATSTGDPASGGTDGGSEAPDEAQEPPGEDPAPPAAAEPRKATRRRTAPPAAAPA